MCIGYAPIAQASGTQTWGAWLIWDEKTPGRYVDLESDTAVRLDGGYLDVGGCYIEVEGLPDGMMAVVLVKDGQLNLLELTVYGGDSWDGEERQWRIV